MRVIADRIVAENLQQLLRTAFARLPVLAQAISPGDAWKQRQYSERKAIGQFAPARYARPGLRFGRPQLRAQVAPVRREHLVRLTLLGRDLPRLAPQRGIVAVHRDALVLQCALDARIARD